MAQPGFFDVDERLKRLSDIGDQLEAYSRVVDFEIFRAGVVRALNYSDGSKGGRPRFDPVLMFKILVIQAENNLSDDRTEFLINDRLSLMRFQGLGLSARVPDAKTIRAFRERLTKPEPLTGCLPASTAPCGGGLPRQGWAVGGCNAGRRAQAAQLRQREAGDQIRQERSPDLAGQAEQGAAEG